MKSMILRWGAIGAGAVALAVAVGAPTMAVAADICEQLTSGGTINLSKSTNTEGCTATLKKDTILVGEPSAKIVAGKHGVVVKLNGHSLKVKDVKLDFKGDFAIAVHGANKSSDKVDFDDVTVNDVASGDCKIASGRVAVVMWKVKTAVVNMSVPDAKVSYGFVFGAPMPQGEHVDAAEQGKATVNGPIAYCKGKTGKVTNRPILAFERAVTWPGGEVESVGPCDFEDPTLVSLRDSGLPGPM